MSDEFFRTQMGRRYYEVTLPRMLREVGRLADGIASLNQTLEARSRPPPPVPATQAPAQAPSRRLRVLLVDDDERVLRGSQRMLGQEHEVVTATSAEAALAILGAREVDVLLTDHGMPDRDGLWLIEQARDLHPGVRRVLTSGQPPELDRHIANGLVHAFVPKPASREDLLASLRTACGAGNVGAQPVKRCVKCGAEIPDPQLKGDERCERCGDGP